MKESFCCQRKIESQKLIFSHSILTRLISFVGFICNWKWFMYNGALLGRASQEKKGLAWSIWFALISKKKINVQPLPIGVCGQLLSNCKMHLIIVYPDTKMLCSSIFEHETAASVTTILKHYVVPVMSHTQKTEKSTSQIRFTVGFLPAKPMQNSPN